MYHWNRVSRQYLYHCGDSSGRQKNSISICSNSRDRNVKFLGVISFRKLLPTCAIPNGILTREVSRTFLKLAKMPWAVSGRRYALLESSTTAPTFVSNIRLNWRGSVKVPAWDADGPTTHSRSPGDNCRYAMAV